VFVADRWKNTLKQRKAKWSKHETARLCHVVSDPRNSTTLSRLYNRAESRAEIDQGRHDPLSNEFPELFNNEGYQPEVSLFAGGDLQAELDQVYPCLLVQERSGIVLKRKWSSLRSTFSISYQKWTASGQADPDNLSCFIDGDPSLLDMFCVFFEKPSLDYALRLFPEEAQTEEGISGFVRAREECKIEKRKEKWRRDQSQSSLADVATQLADAISKPIRIKTMESRLAENNHSESAAMADTFLKLMELESALKTSLVLNVAG
jgi:hypothetical protein